LIIDSSVLVAIFRREAGWDRVLEKMHNQQLAVGSPTMVETAMVLTSLTGPNAAGKLARLVQELGVTIVAFQPAHWLVAAEAFERFGKKRHPAQLNFGDCLTYAVAKYSGQPLVALGDDFPQTDLDLA
jgi:ribonuclease VapC